MKSKIKTLLTIAIIVATLILLVSCNSSNDEQLTTVGAETTIENATTIDTATTVDDSAEATTASETESATEPETEAATTLSPEEEATMKATKIAEILANTETKLLPIGGWSTPATELRDDYTGQSNSYDAPYQLIADAGVNYMITLEEWSSKYWIIDTLSSASKAGLKVYYNAIGQSPEYTNEMLDVILNSEYANSLGGVYVKDEPGAGDLDDVATLVGSVRNKLGADNKLPVFANLFPIYVTPSATGDYTQYVNNYVEKSHPDLIMFDYYPEISDRYAPFKNMYRNIGIVKNAADKAGIDFWFFIKVMNNQEEMLCNVHANLALGGKGFAYFLLCNQHENWNYEHIISKTGEKTKLYPMVQEVNRQILNMRGVYLDYDCKGVLKTSYKDVLTGLKDYPELTLDSFAPLSSVESDNRTLVSCFEKQDGGKGVYLVNTAFTKTAKVILNFEKPVSVEVWGAEGLEDIATGTTVTVKIGKGAGAFVKIDEIK